MGSQMSFLGSLSTQVETFTVQEIYAHLKARDIFPSSSEYAEHVRKLVLTRMQVVEEDLASIQVFDLINETRKFAKEIKRRWQKRRGATRFEENETDYLLSDVKFRVRVRKKKKKIQAAPLKRRKLTVKRLQPSKRDKNMGTLNPRTVRRESAKILKNHRKDAIIHAGKRILGKNGGRVRHSDIVIDQMRADKNYAAKILKKMKLKEPIKITPERFLGLILDRDLSEMDNFEFQVLCAQHNADIVPSRYAVRKVKRYCLDGINIDYRNWEVVVDFPSLRKKTLQRFVTIKKNAEKLRKIRDEYGGHLELIDYWKWGASYFKIFGFSQFPFKVRYYSFI